MNPSRLPLINQLHAAETRLNQLNEQRAAIADPDFKGGTIQFITQTNKGQQSGSSNRIPFDGTLMVEYLDAEIEKLNTQFNNLFNQLADAKQ